MRTGNGFVRRQWLTQKRRNKKWQHNIILPVWQKIHKDNFGKYSFRKNRGFRLFIAETFMHLIKKWHCRTRVICIPAETRALLCGWCLLMLSYRVHRKISALRSEERRVG